MVKTSIVRVKMEVKVRQLGGLGVKATRNVI